MAFTLRPYQLEAVDATIKHFRQHTEPALIVLPTGAGKSLVIAELAKRARGRVLELAHVKDVGGTKPCQILRLRAKSGYLRRRATKKRQRKQSGVRQRAVGGTQPDAV